MSKRRPLVAGNWKMNLGLKEALALTDALLEASEAPDSIDWLVCPSHVWLAPVFQRLGSSSIALGAQDLNEHESGAHTGEVAPGMIADLGCRYVIVGHSERRQLYGDTHQRTASKFLAAVNAGLRPVLCVGESEADREAGRAEAVIEAQLKAVLSKTEPGQWREAVIAYEPVWAIGTGKTASPEDAQQMHAFIRSIVHDFDATIAGLVRIVYGGSVKPDNAAGIFAGADVDGALVGGASLTAESFAAIAQAASAN